MKLVIQYVTGSFNPQNGGRPTFEVKIRGEIDGAQQLTQLELNELLGGVFKAELRRRLAFELPGDRGAVELLEGGKWELVVKQP